MTVPMIDKAIAKVIESNCNRIKQLEEMLGCKTNKCVVCNGSNCPALKNN